MACNNSFKDEMYEELKKFIENIDVEEKQGALISVLHKGQEIFGYLPQEIQEFIAKELDLPVAKVYGVVSFYHFFSMKPKGKYPISVCMGTACYVRGAEKVLNSIKNYLGIDVGETTEDGLFSIDALRCVGACGLAPVVLIGKDVYGKESVKDMKTILEKYRKANEHGGKN
ncbi:NAD(P)H-dependent oxidoreductase subunit E [Cetobacterium sp. 8H]|uniref:NADH-quinone oxidoreductase subunit NuoE family protein n=1 Tax=Cetobacterium sp. 8H TaxID=2759681 RepID=UPI00163CBE5E|nr:NAD(P)H-dependent oxidoreductase subunit E [Cetobacterium sp. 8H]MBC2850568.1 NAD(P)H-dependent oxidoreductase subunit E [Cetobacterium sp. 8H]